MAGWRIAKKPKIKESLSIPPVLWFLFPFNGGVVAVCYFAMDGAKGAMAAAGMGLVSLGAAGGFVANRRKRAEAEAEAVTRPRV